MPTQDLVPLGAAILAVQPDDYALVSHVAGGVLSSRDFTLRPGDLVHWDPETTAIFHGAATATRSPHGPEAVAPRAPWAEGSTLTHP